MKLTRKLLAAILTVCMALALLTPVSAADLQAGYGEASYYDIAVTTYSRMLLFQDGVVPAADQSRQYGLIDPTGKVVLPFQYAYVWTLGGGLFGVATGTDDYGEPTGIGIANSKGQIVLAPSADNQRIECLNGIIALSKRVPDSTAWSGYSFKTEYFTADAAMTPSTAEAYNAGSGPLAQYDWGYSVGGGYYCVGKGGQTGLLNSKYEAVIALGQYDDINVISYGGSTVFVVAKDDGAALLDASLKVVVPFGTYYSIMEHYSGGTTLEVASGDKSGVIDFTGKVLVPLGDYGYNAFGGLNADGYITAIKKDGSTTLYKDGKAVKTYTGKQVTSEVYYRHLAFTTTGEKNGMMTMDEKVIIPDKYDNILDDYNGNLLTVTVNEDSWEYFHGLYTQDGAKILDDKYLEITHQADSKYKLYDGTHYGISKVSGTSVSAVIPMNYVDMRIHTHQFIELFDGSKYSIVDLSNNVVVPESTGEIEVFTSAMKETTDISGAMDRLAYNGEAYDNYTKSVLPFCIKTGSGYATVYADYSAGKSEGQVPYRASNANDAGWFVYQGANGLYGFARTGNGFLDVAPDTWASEAADWAASKGIVKGTGANKFSPTTACKQQEILIMLWRSKGEPTSTVKAPMTVDSWAVDAVNWAYEKGMIDDSFVGSAPCTRAQAVEYIWMAEDKPTAPASTFTDVPADASYAMAVNWAVQKKITTGEGGGRFNPNGVCQRDAIAAFLYRAQK